MSSFRKPERQITNKDTRGQQLYGHPPVNPREHGLIGGLWSTLISELKTARPETLGYSSQIKEMLVTTEERIKVLTDLWKSENAIKTSKLIIFFLATSILASALDIRSQFGWFVPVLGMGFSFVWFFSIGRTVAFQKIWENKVDTIIDSLNKTEKPKYDIFPTLEEKIRIPIYGKIPSKYILLWPPIIGFFLWTIILVFYIA